MMSRHTFLLLFVFAVTVVVLFTTLSKAQSGVRTINPTFTTIDVPGAGETFVQGINLTGDLVGNYAPTLVSPSRGFMQTEGTFVYLDYPGAYATFANGINDSDTIAGYAEFNAGASASGFLFDGVSYTTFRDGRNAVTYGMAVDDNGNVVGGTGTLNGTRGFELRSGRYKGISPPGDYVYVYATGINNLGEVVGWTSNGSESGFVYKNGKYQSLSVSGANDTEARGVNDHGMIVGWYLKGSSAKGFAFMRGKYLSFSYPGAVGTLPSGINAAGQVVGSYTFDFQTYHGFVTTPISTEDFELLP